MSRWQRLGGAQGRVGGKEERPSCQNALALLKERDLTQFLSASKRTLNVDLLTCDLQVHMK